MTLISVLLWKYFIDVVHIYKQLTLRKIPSMIRSLPSMTLHPINWRPYEQRLRSPKTKEILPQAWNINSWLSFQPPHLLYRYQTCQHPKLCKPVPWNPSPSVSLFLSHLSIYLWFCFSGDTWLIEELILFFFRFFSKKI